MPEKNPKEAHDAPTRRLRPAVPKNPRGDAPTLREMAVAAPAEETLQALPGAAGRYSYVAPRRKAVQRDT